MRHYTEICSLLLNFKAYSKVPQNNYQTTLLLLKTEAVHDILVPVIHLISSINSVLSETQNISIQVPLSATAPAISLRNTGVNL